MALLSVAARRRRRQVRQFFWTLAKVVAAAAVLGFTAFSAFEVGTARNAAERRLLEQEAEQREARMQELAEAEATAVERARRLAAALARLERQYAENVPQGVLENLVTLLAERLQAGVPAERLEFVVARASIERVCKSQIESRRLEIRTPVGTDVDNRTSLAGERITVSGEGQPARDEAGVAQAWFDPAKPVVLRFLTIDGDVERVENQLPLTHALVFDDKEYRFLAAPADRRGFVDLAVQECDYP